LDLAYGEEVEWLPPPQTPQEFLDAASAVVGASGAAEAAALAAAKADVWVGTRGFIDLLEWVHLDMAMPW
jgi:hypothetical protein